ncbi:hypothetical protein K438DRAFT_1881940 [Mycena galopus ATCC 62051]|nr:hypothetical protein K438DRAFT_1881940 [Mycena galopus ATCC 62051]
MQVSLAPLFACLALPSLPFHPALTSQPALPVLPDTRSHRICLLRMAALRSSRAWAYSSARSCSLLLLCWVSVSSDDDYFLLHPPFMRRFTRFPHFFLCHHVPFGSYTNECGIKKKRSTHGSAARGPGGNSASAASSADVSKAAADGEEEGGQTMCVWRRSEKGESKRTAADREVDKVEGARRRRS